MTDLREAEAQSIRAFVQSAADEGYLSGRVLDYGCGKQPYRDIIEIAGGEYWAHDLASYPANTSGCDIGEYDPENMEWDSILCTQVVQYLPQGFWFSRNVFHALNRGGHLVMTYPTNWPEVEDADLHRFTKAGMEKLLKEAGFQIMRHDWRHGFQFEGVSFACGYGVIARA